MRASTLLRETRRGAGLTQEQLAARAGLSKTAISMYETGTREPGADTFLRLIHAASAKVTIEAFTPEQLRRGRIFADLLNYAEGFPHRWPGDEVEFPSELWRK